MPFRLAPLLSAAALLAALPATAAVQSFDTPTGSNAETAALYGIVAEGPATRALVVGGALRLDSSERLPARASFATFSSGRDFSIEYDTYNGAPTQTYVDTGLWLGPDIVVFSNAYIYYTSAATGQLTTPPIGFIPSWFTPVHVSVRYQAATRQVTTRLSQGANTGTAFVTTLDIGPDTSFQAALHGYSHDTLPSTYTVFDNLAIAGAVPEPPPLLLLAGGLGLVLAARRRLR